MLGMVYTRLVVIDRLFIIETFSHIQYSMPYENNDIAYSLRFQIQFNFKLYLFITRRMIYKNIVNALESVCFAETNLFFLLDIIIKVSFFFKHFFTPLGSIVVVVAIMHFVFDLDY